MGDARLTPAECVAQALDARLQRVGAAPLAVAFSGGGDSLPLLLAAHAWARGAGRRLVALTVDHGLQAQGAAWADWCAHRAARLGVTHRTLVWQGDRPSSGLAAAARTARHRLIAQAAREEGALVVLFGHTADDVLEARVMRAAGHRTSAPASWSPSPAWPEGRGQFILRPLIETGRRPLRDWLAGQGETWIDDPANQDMREPRARARAMLGAGLAVPACCGERAGLHAGTAGARVGRAGELVLGAAGVTGPGAGRCLAAAIVCVSGQNTAPRGQAIERLLARIAEGRDFSATLSGARVIAAAGEILVVRETGDSRARPAPSLALRPGGCQVFDGRFEVRARSAGLTMTSLKGRIARLGGQARERLAGLHPAAREALPAVIDDSGAVACPTLSADPRLEIRELIMARLAGACGVIRREADLAPGNWS